MLTKFVLGNLKEKKSLGIPRRRLEDPRETGLDGVDWNHLSYDVDR
jgi:hypothetical protein